MAIVGALRCTGNLRSVPASARQALVLAAVLACGCLPSVAAAEQQEHMVAGAIGQADATDPTVPEDWRVRGQFTNVSQWHPAFTSPYSGANSLSSRADSNETTDVTLYAGLRLSESSEVWANPEVDQGFGLSNTMGMAGFPSGEAYKVGANAPYLRIPRLFYRKVIGLGGEQRSVDSAANQLAGARSADNVTLTVGKFSVVDMFDTNTYAHDPRNDFMNWAIVESGAFDYAADSWGYSYGASVEWTQSRWTWRNGFFNLSKVPNERNMDMSFAQHEAVTELEERHQLLGRPGKLKLLLFLNHARMGSYADAVQLAKQTNTAPNTALVRRGSSQTGFAVNFEQELSANFGAFARASQNSGSREAYEFADITRSVSAGVSAQGDRWGRHDDTVGMAAVVNGLSDAARQYFAAGGLGILIGDGQLRHYAPEKIGELYYSLKASDHFKISVDYQHVINPAYNHDRGPVSIYGIRIHGES